MKRKDKESFRTLKLEDLISQENQVRAKISDVLRQAYQGKIKNVREVKMLKHKLAVILSIRNQKERDYEQK